MIPDDLFYSEEHEWVRLEDDGLSVGITDFAQEELGDIVFVELPEVGKSFDAEDEIGSIESVKAVAEVYTPVAGEVVEVNAALEDHPELINEDPYGEGWLVRLKTDGAPDVSGLMNAEAYQEFVAADEED
ncbi:MAG: glycine cleavage system protein GcvH [Thermoanaerobaculia bacterium]